eukprot:3456212-Amphidinium_carterae.1
MSQRVCALATDGSWVLATVPGSWQSKTDIKRTRNREGKIEKIQIRNVGRSVYLDFSEFNCTLCR